MGIGIWGTVAVVRAHLPWYATALACWGIAIIEIVLFQLGIFLSRQARVPRGIAGDRNRRGADREP
jgi:hypothetical protein